MTKYLIDPLGPFHARWRDKYGPIRVLSGPVKGWLMCARPNCRPFILRVSEILNADKPPGGMGPFEPVGAKLSHFPRRARKPMAETEREMLTVIMLKDVLDGIEHFFGQDGLNQVANFASLRNRSRESNRVIDAPELLYGTDDPVGGAR